MPRRAVDLKNQGVRYIIVKADASAGFFSRAGSARRLACAWLALLVLGLGMLAGAPRALAQQRPLGIDVSVYRGAITWSSVKTAGITFAWARATSNTFYSDSTFTNNAVNAKAAGVLIGSYHDACYNENLGTTGAIQEANYFWGVASNYIKGGAVYMMPMLDVEATPNAYNTQTVLSQWINQWCTSVSNYAAAAGCPGVKPLIYVSAAHTGWFDNSVAQWTAWIADYTCVNPQTNNPTYPFTVWTNWVFWQYCSSNSVPGVPGDCDQDVFNSTNSSDLAAYVIGGSPPGITTQPASQTVLVGSSVTFTVGASGATPLAYQWRFNSGNIFGATASSYTKNNVQTTNAGSYSVVITNAYGSTNSANAVLTVHAPPVITAQPANLVTGVTLSVTFSVTATGTAPLSYQWQRTGGGLTGATTSALTIASAQATNAGTYVVVVTNLYGTATSSNAVLTVLDPYITSQPQSQTVAAGAPATFSVGAVGTAPLTYRWSQNDVALADGGNISGSGTLTLTLASVQVGNVGTYSVTVSNVSGSVVSSNAALVAPFAPVIVTEPASQTVPAGSTVSLAVGVIGPGPMTYQWQAAGTNLVDGGNTSGSATASLTVSNVQAGEMGNYSVVVSNTYGAVSSSNALVTVWPLLGWGDDVYGQADVPAGLSNVVAVAAGGYHSLAVRGDGTVVAWGAGLTDTGVSSQYGQAIVPGGLSNVASVAGGYYHSLALESNGTVVAWGAGTTNTGVTPQCGQSLIPSGLSNVTEVAGGGYHSLALKADGTVVAWGAGTTNSGSNPNYGQALVPAGLSNVVAIASGGFHSLALEANGTVLAWGAGTTNTGTAVNWGQSLIPAGLSNVVAIAGGLYHSLALEADGTVVAWGAGATNTGSIPNYGQALVPAGLSNVVGIAAGIYHSLALRADGSVVIWGAGTSDTGTSPNYGQALVPEGLTNVTALVGGGFHTLALEGDGQPYLTTQPVSQTAPAGATVVYAALAVGSPPLSYQWQFNGTNISGATAGALSLANVQLASAGTYSVTVTNALGTAISANALLTVIGPAPRPQIDSLVNLPGGGFELEVSGGPGNFAIDCAPGLAGWTQLSSLSATGAVFQYIDPETNQASRYYRVRVLP